MNAQDRKKVSDIKSRLEALHAQFEDLKFEIQDLADDEQQKFDGMSEGLQQTDKGQDPN